MAQAQLLDPSERLPWLSDTSRPRPQPRQARRSWVPLMIALTAAGAIAYGGWTAVERSAAPEPASVTPARTVPLPPPSVPADVAAEPQAPSASEREALRPAAEPAAKPAPAKRSSAAASRRAETRTQRRRSEASRAPAATAPAYEPRTWNSGVRGRIIQLGAFRTSAQAQAEWRRVYARYPLLRPLSPRVLKSRIRGRTYHRLQLGTFSHAHSELLCQRLRTLGEGCIVLGLPKRGQGR